MIPAPILLVEHAMPPPLMGLNEAQLAAVTHGAGPLLVLAGPGSGKTRVVTHRIARLVEQGVPASEILAVTFTNRAAREMRQRVRSLVRNRAKGLTVCTFHSACVRILRKEIDALGYERNFTIYDEASQQSLVRTILRDLKGSGAPKSPSSILERVEQANLGVPATAGAEPSAERAQEERAISVAVDRYREELRARNAVDFDDLLLLVLKLFRAHEEVRERWQRQYRHVLVDEYQDTNAQQDEILRLLVAGHRNLFAVGDDDQGIYGWRGAEVENILSFARRIPDATIVRLEQNYRSTGGIVSAANGVMAGAARRHPKTIFTELGPGDRPRLLILDDENEEADFIAGEIAADLAARGGDPWKAGAEHAVLFRTNEQMRPLEQALRQASVPYRLLGGRSFFDRKEVLDLLAYLRLACNRRDDEALFRVINTPSRGLGARSLLALRAEAAARQQSPWDVMEGVGRGELLPADVPSRCVGPVRQFVEAVDRLAAAAESRTQSLVADLIDDIDYREEIDRLHERTEVRAQRLAIATELQRAWEAYLSDAPQPDLSEFLDGITLRDKEEDPRGDGVTLATIHASKGLEFTSVFVAGVEEGILPHARSLEDERSMEEERRLLYVAMTRAKRKLTLSIAKARSARGKEVKRVPSRFLQELGDELLDSDDGRAPATEQSVAGHLARMRAALGRDESGESDPAG